MNELKGKKIEVLDRGFVELVDYMGSDGLIVNAARVSYGGKKKSSDKALIEYLMRNDHTSPFEMVEFIFRIKVPIFVARQIFRHRTASFNEVSGRYTVFQDEFFMPREFRKNILANKQSSQEIGLLSEELLAKISKFYDDSYSLYNELIEFGLAKELARTVLPLSTYTMFYYKQDLKNLLHFLRLRLDEHTQKETRIVAQAMAYFVQQVVPWTWEAFENYKIKSASLSKKDIEKLDKENLQALKEILNKIINSTDSKTRKEELAKQFSFLLEEEDLT